MKSRISQGIPPRGVKAHVFEDTSEERFFIVDWKDINQGPIRLEIERPVRPDTGALLEGIHIDNRYRLPITANLFGENALPIRKGVQAQQCECMLFPSAYHSEAWILFIEMKYSEKEAKAMNPKNNYGPKMKAQIAETVKYFRDREIFPQNKLVYAVAAFPTLLADTYSAFLYDTDEIEELFFEKRIIMRATDRVEVMSDTELIIG